MSNIPEVQQALEETLEKFENMSQEEFRTAMNISYHTFYEENLHIHSPEFLRIT